MTIITPKSISIAQLIGKDQIDQVVDDFYNRARNHPSLAQPFSIVHDWPGHKEKIAQFWWVVLGGIPKASYKYDPVRKHFSAGFNATLLSDWKYLFKTVLQDHLNPELSDKWYSRVEIIGDNLLIQDQRLHHERLNPS